MWTEENNCLSKKFLFDGFVEAMKFINKVATVAESLNHHPTIINTYNKVELILQTHDKGNTVTELDWQLAKEIDRINEI